MPYTLCPTPCTLNPGTPHHHLNILCNLQTNPQTPHPQLKIISDINSPHVLNLVSKTQHQRSGTPADVEMGSSTAHSARVGDTGAALRVSLESPGIFPMAMTTSLTSGGQTQTNKVATDVSPDAHRHQVCIPSKPDTCHPDVSSMTHEL
jgi:hypothetical protein